MRLLILFISCFGFVAFSCCNRHIAETKVVDIPMIDSVDTIYGGFVKNVVYFENPKTFSSTFIITDNITLSIAGKHEIPQNVKCYAYIYNKKRTSAVFTWDGEEKTYKILTE